MSTYPIVVEHLQSDQALRIVCYEGCKWEATIKPEDIRNEQDYGCPQCRGNAGYKYEVGVPMTNTSERAQLEWSGIPARGGAIQFTRRGAGCQIATVYGVGPRAFRIKVVRLMDGPGWQLEPCYVYFGVDQPLDAVTRANLFLDGFEGARDPRSSLKEARSLVWDIWSEWRSRLGTDDERVQTFGGPGAGVAR